MAILKVLICIIQAYLIGSIQTSILMSRARHDDIRTHGSGNAGTTNALRVYGVKAGLFTFACDFFKAFLAVAIAYFLSKINMGRSALDGYLIYLAGIFVIIGHSFPVFFGFRGGKGAATSLGTIWVVFAVFADNAWWIPVATTVIGVGAVVIFNMVSVGSLSGAVTQLVSVLIFYGRDNVGACLLALIIFVLLFVRHRKNIVRIIHGEERKLIEKKNNSHTDEAVSSK